MKIISKILLLLLFFGCSSIIQTNKKLPIIDLVVKQDKYSLILKHHFYKNLNSVNNSLEKITIKTNLSFSAKNTLSNSGNNNLNILNGKVDFQILNSSKTELSSGSVSSSINTGSVSSLYGIDENSNFAKERLSKHLASKLFRRIFLSISSSEN